jgi:hypothetical protein
MRRVVECVRRVVDNRSLVCCMPESHHQPAFWLQKLVMLTFDPAVTQRELAEMHGPGGCKEPQMMLCQARM